MLRTMEEFVDTRPKKPSAECRWGNPLDDDTTRSRSSHAQGRQRCLECGRSNFSPEVPERPVQDTKLGGPPTRVTLDTSPCLSRRHVRRGVPAEQACVFERKSAVCDGALKNSARSPTHLQSPQVRGEPSNETIKPINRNPSHETINSWMCFRLGN